MRRGRAALVLATAFACAVAAARPAAELEARCEQPGAGGLAQALGPAQTARELRRRIAAIEADPLLVTSAQGRACRDAYWFELRNTRVVLVSQARAVGPATPATAAPCR
jgi:hypothetical protein